MDDDPCDSFLQVDEEENFDVCYHCQYHRLDHKEYVGECLIK